MTHEQAYNRMERVRMVLMAAAGEAAEARDQHEMGEGENARNCRDLLRHNLREVGQVLRAFDVDYPTGR
ncbi:hypothetical protein KAJ83_01515 [Marivibrio halodurans]|uniref:Uncharacterized protein n=1 Tax=Marivibrio halodurans TaxID=2039722 RepID=A0A8J7RWG5_9PROT|nr:hypothetical protein [Marivibrio halodurans]MBP5855670.1 hypothetical protein [Marivibrio halodurans]